MGKLVLGALVLLAICLCAESLSYMQYLKEHEPEHWLLRGTTRGYTPHFIDDSGYFMTTRRWKNGHFWNGRWRDSKRHDDAGRNPWDRLTTPEWMPPPTTYPRHIPTTLHPTLPDESHFFPTTPEWMPPPTTPEWMPPPTTPEWMPPPTPTHPRPIPTTLHPTLPDESHFFPGPGLQVTTEPRAPTTPFRIPTSLPPPPHPDDMAHPVKKARKRRSGKNMPLGEDREILPEEHKPIRVNIPSHQREMALIKAAQKRGHRTNMINNQRRTLTKNEREALGRELTNRMHNDEDVVIYEDRVITVKEKEKKQEEEKLAGKKP